LLKPRAPQSVCLLEIAAPGQLTARNKIDSGRLGDRLDSVNDLAMDLSRRNQRPVLVMESSGGHFSQLVNGIL